MSQALGAGSAVSRFPGHPVNVFMPHHMWMLQDEYFWTSPKTDGTAWLIFISNGRVYFSDSSYRWYTRSGVALRRVGVPEHLRKRLKGTLVVHGEWVDVKTEEDNGKLLECSDKRPAESPNTTCAADDCATSSNDGRIGAGHDGLGNCPAAGVEKHGNSRGDVGDGGGGEQDTRPRRMLPTFYIFDVFVYRGTCVKFRSFAERFKFAPLIAEAMMEACPAFDTYIKPFFRASTQLGFVVDNLRSSQHTGKKSRLGPASAPAFDTDGLIFQHAHVGTRPIKFKETSDITVDFVLDDGDGVSLYLSAERGEHKPTFVDRLAACPVPKSALRPNLVVECEFDDTVPSINPHPGFPLSGQWKFVRVRPFKTRSNSKKVLDRNTLLIRTGFTLERLKWTAENARGRAEVATEAEAAEPSAAANGGYYGAVSRPSRKEHQNFHNRVVKDSVYEHFLRGCEQLLELGVGRGADVSRWEKHGNCLRRIVGADIDSVGLAECKRRWNLQRKKQAPSGRVVLETCEINLNNPVDAELFGGDFRGQFDVAVANFSAHYFWRELPLLAADVLRPGGVLVITLFDCATVDRLVPNIGDLRRFEIDGELEASIRRTSRTTIGVWMKSIGKEHEEDLVDMYHFIQSMKRAGLDLETDRNFCSWADDDRMTPGNARFANVRYGDAHPMWKFTELNCCFAFRKLHRPTRPPQMPPSPKYSNTAASPPTLPPSPKYTATSPAYTATPPAYTATSPAR